MLVSLCAGSAFAAEPNPAATRVAADYVPDVAALAVPAVNELRDVVERFVADKAELERFASVKSSARHQRRMREFFTTWQERLAQIDFEKLGVEGRLDATMLRTRLAHELRLLQREAKRTGEMAPLVPFAEDVAGLQEARRFLQPVEAKAAAGTLENMRKALEKTRAAVETGLKATKEKSDKAESITVSKVVAFRAANRVDELRKSLEEWF